MCRGLCIGVNYFGQVCPGTYRGARQCGETWERQRDSGCRGIYVVEAMIRDLAVPRLGPNSRAAAWWATKDPTTLVPVAAIKDREICSEVITASTLTPACLGRDGGGEEKTVASLERDGGRSGGRVVEKARTQVLLPRRYLARRTVPDPLRAQRGGGTSAVTGGNHLGVRGPVTDRQLLKQWRWSTGRMLCLIGDCWGAPNSQWVSPGGVAMTLAAEEAASNPRRPAWWPGPISDVQRAAPSPIGGLHDGAGGRVYKRSRRRRGRRWPRHHRHIHLSVSCVWEVGSAACLFGPALRIVHCSPDPGPCHPQLGNLGVVPCLRPVVGFPPKPSVCWPTGRRRRKNEALPGGCGAPPAARHGTGGGGGQEGGCGHGGRHRPGHHLLLVSWGLRRGGNGAWSPWAARSIVVLIPSVRFFPPASGCSRTAAWRSSPTIKATASRRLMWPSHLKGSVWSAMQPRTSSPPILRTQSSTPSDSLAGHGTTLPCSRTSSFCLSRFEPVLLF